MHGCNRASRGACSPSLASFVVVRWGVGAMLGAVFAVLLVVTNAGGLHDLIWQSQDAIVAIALLVFGFTTLIAGLYAGAAIMLLSARDE